MRSTVHWHAHSVHSLSYTPDGAYLLSGGSEGVLVVWQLGTMEKTFLPRLGSPLTSLAVSPDGTLYLLGHDDSSIRVLQAANLRLRQLIQGIKAGTCHAIAMRHECGSLDGGSIWGVLGAWLSLFAVAAHQQGPRLPPMLSGLVIEPRLGALVVNGVPGMLQFYQFDQDRHLAEVEVVARNRIGRTDRGWTAQPRVELVAFSAQGAWMATVDRIDDSETPAVTETTLRLWRWDADTQGYASPPPCTHTHTHTSSAPRKGKGACGDVPASASRFLGPHAGA